MSDTNLNETLTSPQDGLSEARTRFAAWLKDAREQSGLSVESVAYETKINRSYIMSLESGDIEALPGKVFGRGFVKCITRLLKTDGVEGLRLYDACWGSNIMAADVAVEEQGDVQVHKTRSVMARIAEPVNTTSPVTQRLMVGGFSPAGEKPRMPSIPKSQGRAASFNAPSHLVRAFVSPYVRMWFLGVVATLFVGLVFGRWAASHWHKSRLISERSQVSTTKAEIATSRGLTGTISENGVERNHNNSSTEVMSNDQQDSISVAQNVGTETVVGFASSTKAAPKALAKNEDSPLYLPSDSAGAFEQVVEIKVANAVEVRLKLDGKKIENTWYKPDSYRFAFNNTAELYLLDASEVEVVYNGKSLGVLGNKGRKRRIYFQAKASESDFPQ